MIKLHAEMETGELLHGPVKVYSCSMGLWVAKELSDRKEVVIRVLRSEEEARAFVAFRERENEVWLCFKGPQGIFPTGVMPCSGS